MPEVIPYAMIKPEVAHGRHGHARHVGVLRHRVRVLPRAGLDRHRDVLRHLHELQGGEMDAHRDRRAVVRHRGSVDERAPDGRQGGRLHRYFPDADLPVSVDNPEASGQAAGQVLPRSSRASRASPTSSTSSSLPGHPRFLDDALPRERQPRRDRRTGPVPAGRRPARRRLQRRGRKSRLGHRGRVGDHGAVHDPGPHRPAARRGGRHPARGRGRCHLRRGRPVRRLDRVRWHPRPPVRPAGPLLRRRRRHRRPRLRHGHPEEHRLRDREHSHGRSDDRSGDERDRPDDPAASARFVAGRPVAPILPERGSAS